MSRRYFIVIAPILAVLSSNPAAWLEAKRKPAHMSAIQTGSQPKLAVVSLNLARETDSARIVAELRNRHLTSATDVFLLQEVVRQSAERSSVAEEVASELGMDVLFASPDGGSTIRGLAILSRYSLEDPEVTCLKDCNLVIRNRKRISLAATAMTPLGSVRVFNAHLDTRINPAERLLQLEPVIQSAAAYDGPSVIGGDLNTNDMHWVWNILPVPNPGKQANEIYKAMQVRGFATPFGPTGATFDHLGMQLDWIFSRQLTATRAAVQPLDFSDHHAIWAELNSPIPARRTSSY